MDRVSCNECGWEGTTSASLDNPEDDSCPICGNTVLEYIIDTNTLEEV